MISVRCIDFEVARAVVLGIAVLVVNDFGSCKQPPKVLLHREAVFQDIALFGGIRVIWSIEVDVATNDAPTPCPRRIPLALIHGAFLADDGLLVQNPMNVANRAAELIGYLAHRHPAQVKFDSPEFSCVRPQSPLSHSVTPKEGNIGVNVAQSHTA
jgi:hypothetical protein